MSPNELALKIAIEQILDRLKDIPKEDLTKAESQIKNIGEKALRLID